MYSFRVVALIRRRFIDTAIRVFDGTEGLDYTFVGVITDDDHFMTM